CGIIDNLNKFEEEVLNPSQEDYKEFKIQELKRTKPVPIGFEIINEDLDQKLKDGYYPVRLKNPTIKSPQTKKSKQTKTDYEKEYYKIVNGKSWKITKPFRTVLNKLKNKG